MRAFRFGKETLEKYSSAAVYLKRLERQCTYAIQSTLQVYDDSRFRVDKILLWRNTGVMGKTEVIIYIATRVFQFVAIKIFFFMCRALGCRGEGGGHGDDLLS